MSGKVRQALSEIKGDQIIEVSMEEFPSQALILALEYCKVHNYERIENIIQFPMPSNKIEDNVG